MEQPKTNFFSDSRNIAKLSTKTILLGVLGFLGFTMLLPFLLTVIWSTVNLIVGMTVLGTLLYVLTSKGTWRRLGYLSDKIAKMLTFWIIEWDEFIIQENAIKKAKADREDIRVQASSLLGEVATKDDELAEAEKLMKEAQAISKELLLRNGNNAEDPETQIYINDYVRQKEFIEDIKPLRDQIEQLAKVCQKIYTSTGMKIIDAEKELKTQKTRLKSLTAGETAMNKALSIFQSENPDVKSAEDMVKQKIGQKIGNIRNTLDIINPIMNERSLKDKVKVKEAMKQLTAIEAVENVQVNIPVYQPKQTLFN